MNVPPPVRPLTGAISRERTDTWEVLSSYYTMLNTLPVTAHATNELMTNESMTI